MRESYIGPPETLADDFEKQLGKKFSHTQKEYIKVVGTLLNNAYESGYVLGIKEAMDLIKACSEANFSYRELLAEFEDLC